MPIGTDRVRLGPFEVDLKSAELRRDGVKVRLQDQPFRVLVTLLEHAGDVVTREELRQRLWPADTFVDFERSLNAAVKRLREALGESADAPEYVETIPKRGYRLVAAVEVLPPAGLSAPAPRAAHSPAQPPGRAVPSRRRLWLLTGGAGVVLAALLAGWLWSGRGAGGPVPATGSRKVVVAVFANGTGDASLDVLGPLIGHWLTQSLFRIGADVTMNPDLPSVGRTGISRPTATAGPDPIRALAARTGAGLVVSGAYFLDGDRIRVQSQVMDGATGSITVTLAPAVGPRDKPEDVVASVANVVMGWIATKRSRAAEGRLAGMRPPTYDAYVEFERGQDAVSGGATEEAERHLTRSLQFDPTFVIARTSLWSLLVTAGRDVEANEVLLPLEEPTGFGQATAIEQAYIRFMRALLDGNWSAQLAAAREVARLEPSASQLGTLGNTERRAHHPRAALEAYSRIRPEDVPAAAGSGGGGYLWRRSQLQHELERYDGSLEDARLGQHHYPANPAFYSAEAGALIALGRLAELDGMIARFEKENPASRGLGAVLFNAARELAAHGHAEAAKVMAGRAAVWYKARLDAGRPTVALRDVYANALIHAGACAQGVAIRRALAREAPDNLVYQSQYASALAVCGGSRAEALRIADVLGKADRPYAHGRHLYLRARVLAALGLAEEAVQALEASYARGFGFDNPEMHLNYGWHPIRTHPAFIEWLKPKG